DVVQYARVRIKVGDRVDHQVWLVRKFHEILALRSAAQHENGLVAHLHAALDVGLHRVADHYRFAGGHAEFLAGHPHHHGARLADAEGLNAGSFFDERNDRTATGARAAVGGAVRVEIR